MAGAQGRIRTLACAREFRRAGPAEGEPVLAQCRVTLCRADLGDLAAITALQRAAYARNRPLLGVEPLPLLADYGAVMRDMEVWVSEEDARLVGALILEPRAEDLLIWSIAADPAAQGSGLGRALLAAAEQR